MKRTLSKEVYDGEEFLIERECTLTPENQKQKIRECIIVIHEIHEELRHNKKMAELKHIV